MKFWLKSENKPAFEFARLSTKHYSKSFYISAINPMINNEVNVNQILLVKTKASNWAATRS